jgi:hypothetical protein
MGTAELTLPGVPFGDRRCLPVRARSIAAVYAGVWGCTLLGAAIGTIVPALAPGGRPHPTLTGSIAEMASIAVTNARVLSAPFLLALFRFPTHRRARQLGDLLVGGILAGKALRVGLALGRWHSHLLPYVPQLPIEWIAGAVAGAAWLNLRTGIRGRVAAAFGAAVLTFVAAAAVVEIAATPHANPRAHGASVNGSEITLRAVGHLSLRKAGGGLPALRSCAGAGSRFKVASLPSPRCRSVPLGRLAGAAGLRQPPPDPAKEGPQ